MKKMLILIVVGVLAFQVQDSYALLRVGIKGGLNFAGIHVTNDSLVYKRTPGITLGAQVEVAVAPALSIRTDLLYVDRSTKFDVKSVSGVVVGSGRLKLNELVLAPFLIVRFPTPKGVIPFLQAGPEVGLRTLLSTNQGGQGQSVNDIWRKNNFSMNVGAGILIPAGGGDLTLDGRYNFGLINLHKSGPVKAYTNGIQIFLGYNFFKV
jgi:hypothetical protein